jgi:hypothetical protein
MANSRPIQKLFNTDTKVDNNQNSNDFIFFSREDLNLSNKKNVKSTYLFDG